MNDTSGPNQLAALIEAKIGELITRRSSAGSQDDRTGLNRQLRVNRDLLRWCKTRAGYRADQTPAFATPIADSGDEA
ncbi:hypothetical protein QP150_16180 [Sphingomonas sp. 22L2VL55-3]